MGALFGAPGLEVLTESSINRDIWAADTGGPINQLFREQLESGLPQSSRHFPAPSPGVIKTLWADATQMVTRRSEAVLILRLKGTATETSSCHPLTAPWLVGRRRLQSDRTKAPVTRRMLKGSDCAESRRQSGQKSIVADNANVRGAPNARLESRGIPQ